MYQKLQREVAISGKSQSTLDNYARHVAHLVLHYNCPPTELDAEQIKDYLHLVKEQGRSRSFFKFTVYGLRMVYRTLGQEELRVALPAMSGSKALPVVLSQQEVQRLLRAPNLLKHRIMLALLYGCGLRNAELRALRIEHLGFDRQQLHVHEGKGGRDRVLPLCDMLVRGIKKYIAVDHPTGYLFTGNSPQDASPLSDVPCSAQAVRWSLAQAVNKAGINKRVSVHTLRHTYATHLLEMGLDIVSIKELMGHAAIETTMVYLQVATCGRSAAFSPLDKLYGQAR